MLGLTRELAAGGDASRSRAEAMAGAASEAIVSSKDHRRF
jgi:hypothetical protein